MILFFFWQTTVTKAKTELSSIKVFLIATFFLGSTVIFNTFVFDNVQTTGFKVLNSFHQLLVNVNSVEFYFDKSAKLNKCT